MSVGGWRITQLGLRVYKARGGRGMGHNYRPNVLKGRLDPVDPMNRKFKLDSFCSLSLIPLRYLVEVSAPYNIMAIYRFQWGPYMFKVVGLNGWFLFLFLLAKVLAIIDLSRSNRICAIFLLFLCCFLTITTNNKPHVIGVIFLVYHTSILLKGSRRIKFNLQPSSLANSARTFSRWCRDHIYILSADKRAIWSKYSNKKSSWCIRLFSQ